MVQDEFVNCYYRLLLKKLAVFNVDPDIFIKALNTGVMYMVKNDGTRSNEDAFWIGYQTIMEKPSFEMSAAFNEFYANEFNQAIVSTQPTHLARELIDLCHEKGCRLILATSPLFPKAATFNRIRWAGLKPDDFEFITTYEVCTFCKPSLGYYKELIDRLNIDPYQSMMIGNDPSEDMVAKDLGFTTYLVTDTLENRSGKRVEPDITGTLKQLYRFLQDTL